MATYSATPLVGLDFGIAATGTDEFLGTETIQTGFYPPISSADYMLKGGTTLSKFQPVMLDADKYLVPATQGTPAIGVALRDLAPKADTKASIWVSGCLNPNLLAWDASYTTDEQKRMAFVGAPTPTNIIIQSFETYKPSVL